MNHLVEPPKDGLILSMKGTAELLGMDIRQQTSILNDLADRLGLAVWGQGETATGVAQPTPVGELGNLREYLGRARDDAEALRRAVERFSEL